MKHGMLKINPKKAKIMIFQKLPRESVDYNLKQATSTLK